MSILSDYQRMVEEPQKRAYEAEIAALRRLLALHVEKLPSPRPRPESRPSASDWRNHPKAP